MGVAIHSVRAVPREAVSHVVAVASGEQIGQLSRVLSRLADYIERSNALVQKVRLAFIYPGIVTVVAFAIVIFLLTYVVPQVANVFAGSKHALPFLTVAMLSVSAMVLSAAVPIDTASAPRASEAARPRPS